MNVRNKKDAWRAAKKAFPMSRAKMKGGRLTMESWTDSPENGGILVKRSVGPTRAALLREHAYGKCWAWCSFCMHEMDQYAKELAKNETTIHT
jgi:hypothetical protein